MGSLGWIGCATSYWYLGSVVVDRDSYGYFFSQTFNAMLSLGERYAKSMGGESYIFCAWMMILVQDCWLEVITAFCGPIALSGLQFLILPRIFETAESSHSISCLSDFGSYFTVALVMQ